MSFCRLRREVGQVQGRSERAPYCLKVRSEGLGLGRGRSVSDQVSEELCGLWGEHTMVAFFYSSRSFVL